MYLIGQISRKNLISLALLLLFTAITSFFEFLVLSESVELAKTLTSESSESSRLHILLKFIFIFLITNLLRLYLIYLQTFTSQRIGAEIAEKIFFNLISARTTDIAGGNESVFVAALISKVNLFVSRVILGIVTVISTTLLIIAISASIYIFVGMPFIHMMLAVCFFYLFLFTFLKKWIKEISKITSQNQIASTQLVNQVFQSFQMMKVLKLEKIFLTQFSKFDYPFRLSQARLQFLSAAPRYILEIIGITAFAIFMFIGSTYDNIELTSFGALAIGIQRLMPLTQLIYANFSNIAASKQITNDVSQLVKECQEDYKAEYSFNFESKNAIKLENICYQFPGTSDRVIDNLNLNLSCEQMILINGPSGCGKSTLLDLLLGLRKPTYGMITHPTYAEEFLKNTNYFGLCPQKTPIITASIIDNISLGKKLTNDEILSVDQLLIRLNLSKTIEQLPDGLNTIITPYDGVLSGGERQRLGLIRALYRKPKVLILDEVTSALDVSSEEIVMKILSETCTRGTTVIAVSHSTRITEYFDVIINYDANNGFYVA